MIKSIGIEGSWEGLVTGSFDEEFLKLFYLKMFPVGRALRVGLTDNYLSPVLL